ncbi:MAG: sigma-70 family RNA polymerase sigma factor [Clostridia bacterium]|nr:sigma-70 family RNA polymerase sigma factor [Clostridia bacterium]
MDEKELLEKARGGDAKAFEQLATPYEQMVWRVCWQLTGNHEDAQDCAQEALLKAWSRLASFREASAFSTWLYRIAVTCCLDAQRRKKLRTSDSVDALHEQGIDFPSSSPGPQERLEHVEHRETVRRALASLPDEQRTPLILSCIEGKSYEEIASILSLPVGTVRSRISRGRLNLKKILSDLSQNGNSSTSSASKNMKGGAFHDL